MPPWLLAALFCLAVHRASRLVGQDTFPPILWFRTRLTRGLPEDDWRVYLLGNEKQYGCPWCISLWLGGFAALGLALTTHLWPWYGWVLLWLAASSTTGLVAQLED